MEGASIDEVNVTLESTRIVPRDQALSSHIKDEPASWQSAWFNVSNVTVGAGTLSLPFALKLCGLGLGVFLIVAMAVLAAFSLRLLLWTAELCGQSSYQDVARHAYGRRCALAVDAAVVINCFAIVLAYIIIIGDLLPPVFQEWSGEYKLVIFQRTFVMAVIAYGAMFPLSCARRLHFLRHTSLVALLCMCYLAVLVVVWAGITGFDDTDRGNVNNEPDVLADVVWIRFESGVFVAIPIMAFAYTSHIQVYKIYDEMHIHDIPLMMFVVYLSVGSITALYLIVAVFSYSTFYNATDGMVLNNFTEDKEPHVFLAKIGLSITLIFSAPLFVHPLRENFLHLCFPSAPWLEVFSWRRQLGVTFVLVSLAFIVAVFVPDVEDVLALTGSTTSVLVMYIFPAAFYLALCPQCEDTEGAAVRKYGAYGLLVWGILIGIAGSVLSVLDFFGVSEFS